MLLAEEKTGLSEIGPSETGRGKQLFRIQAREIAR